MDSHRLIPRLSAVPETMLWTRHNRVSEAILEKGILHDPDAVKIYQTLNYDFKKSFGPAEPSHAIRSAMFDAELDTFLKQHKNGVIVNLGEGLETQRFRVAGDDALWLSVDVPEAIAIRERFISPDDHHLHIRRSVLDRLWFNEVPTDRPIYITAQGLLMYLPEEQVRLLFQDFAMHFPEAWFAFDTIPGWLPRKTTSVTGWKKTVHYTTPKMPWGIDRYRIKSTLQDWVPTLDEVTDLPWWRFPRGVGRWLFPILTATPILRRYTPAITRIQFASEEVR